MAAAGYGFALSGFINSSILTLIQALRLSLAGVTSLQTLQSPDNSVQQDFYTNQITDFLTLKAATV